MKVENAEGEVLAAVILFDLCRHDEAKAAAANVIRRFTPIRDGLTRLEASITQASDADRARFVREERKEAPVLADRGIGDVLDYDAFLAKESAVLAAAPASFRSSKLGEVVVDVMQLVRPLVQRRLAEVAGARVRRAADEITTHVRDAQKLLIDVTAAERGLASPGHAVAEHPSGPRVTLSWPVNGPSSVYDPAGYYRSEVASKCR
jgi:hypothetical protein